MRKLLKKYLLYALGAMCLTGCGTAGKTDAAGSVLAPVEYMKMLQSDKKAYLLDVRRADEYAAGHLPGAALLDVTDSVAFARGVELLDKGIKLIQISIDRTAAGAAVVDRRMGQPDVDEIDLASAEMIYRNQRTGFISGDHFCRG